jgi:hypothetical protein
VNTDTFEGIFFLLVIIAGIVVITFVVSKLFDILVNLLTFFSRKFSLTEKGKVALFLTGIAIILELLYPPRAIIRHSSKLFLGFHPIWETKVNNYPYVSVDSSLLIIEFAVTLLIGFGIYHLTKSYDLRNRDASLISSENQPLSKDLNYLALNIAEDLKTMRKSWFKGIVSIFKKNFSEKEILNDKFNEQVDLILKTFQLGLVFSFLERKKYLSSSEEEKLEDLLLAYVFGTQVNECLTYFKRYWEPNIDTATAISRFIIDVSSYIVGKDNVPTSMPLLTDHILLFAELSSYVIAYAFQDKKELSRIRKEMKEKYDLDL